MVVLQFVKLIVILMGEPDDVVSFVFYFPLKQNLQWV